MVRVKINIDSYKSRYPGLLPYIEYGGTGEVVAVSDLEKGNFGGFPVSVVSGKSYYDILHDFHNLSTILDSCRFFSRISEGLYAEIDQDEFLEKGDSSILSFRDIIKQSPDACLDMGGIDARADGLFLISGCKEKKVIGIDGRDDLLSYEIKDYSGTYSGIRAYERIEKDYLGRIYVPEKYRSGSRCSAYIYWASVRPLIIKMEGLQFGRKCCSNETYADFGGDDFLSYLKKIQKAGIKPVPVKEAEKPLAFSLSLSILDNHDNLGVYNIIEDDKSETGVVKSWYDKDDVFVPSQFDRFIHLAGYQYDEVGDSLDGTYPVSVSDSLVAFPGCFEFADNKWNIIRRPINVKTRAITDEETELSGDFIVSCEEGNDSYRFLYIIGGKFDYDEKGNAVWIEKTGIEYLETIPFVEEIKEGCFSENGERKQYLQRNLMLDANVGYSLNYDKLVNVRQATVHFTQSDLMAESYVFPAISQDYNVGLSDDIAQGVNVSVDRGASAAFERHFKICECKTFADLKNYGNNFFNLV